VGQKSSVEKLPKNLREKLLEMLNDPACTQAWIVEAINGEAGEAVLSKSGVNRYALRMKKFAEKNRQAVVNPLRGFTSGVSLCGTP
jgi:DNA-binding transcriptional regulator WhiA